MRREKNSAHQAVFLSAVLLFLANTTSLLADAQSEVNALTGNIHTRVAWREGGDQIDGGGNAIKGFDSQTGQVSTIWNSACVKSVIVAGGHKVALTSGDYKVWIVDWDGQNPAQLATGSVSDGWRDENGREWVIYRASGTGTGGGIYRVAIDNSSDKVLITNSPEGHDVYPWFQISADGKRAASFFPYSTGGFLNLETGDYQQVADGCWSGMASDNSYYWFHLNGNHNGLQTFRNAQGISNVGAMPPIQPDDGQIYCPRAAEGPEHGGQFFLVSGGYPGYNTNGDTVEVFLGKFNPERTSVAGWARVTNNNVPDQHPTAWIGVESLGPPELTRISLAPAGSNLMLGESVDFTADTKDQNGSHFDIEGSLTWAVDGGGSLSGQSNTGATFTSNGSSEGTFIVTVSKDDVSATASVKVSDPSNIHVKINSGGAALDDWEAGTQYITGGEDYDFGDGATNLGDIADPAPAGVYQTVRHGDHQTGVDVPNGDYTVRLHFMDAHVGERLMIYKIEGDTKLSDFNITEAAGGTLKAVVKEFCVTVSDGRLDIAAEQGGGNDVFESGIEVIAGDHCSPTNLAGNRVHATGRTLQVTRVTDNAYRISVPFDSDHRVEIVRSDGKVVRTFVSAGVSTIRWDTSAMASGAYVVRATVGDRTHAVRVPLMR